MTLWLIRAGSRGEHEQKFLDEGRVDENLWELEVCLSPANHSSPNRYGCGGGESNPPYPP
jgi:hypothetical protein